MTMQRRRFWIICLALALFGWPSRVFAQQPSVPTTWTGPKAWDIPGEYVVDFVDELSTESIDALLKAVGLTGFQQSPSFATTKIAVVELSGRQLTRLERLRTDRRVQFVEPHARLRATFVPDDPRYQEQWHLRHVGAEVAWAHSLGRGVTVAVVDTGIACATLDGFTKATDLGKTRCVPGINMVRRHRSSNDDHGHGTHVAGTIAQSTNNALGVAGLAYGARLMPVKVLSAKGWGTTTGVAAGIRWAASNGAQVINLSLGGPRNSRILQAAVHFARSQGAVVVAAAGNSSGAVGFPGASQGVLGVSASDEEDRLAWFSSRGRGVDIAAPGVRVVQQTICEAGRNACEIFGSFNGTSMASPHVAAAAAMLMSQGVVDADAVQRQLQTSAKALPGDPDGHFFGAGLLQVDAAVRRVALSRLGYGLVASCLATWLAFAWSRRRNDPVRLSPWHPGLVVAALASSVGLLAPVAWLGLERVWLVDLLARPLADWDLLLDASWHTYLPFAHVGVPLGACLLWLSIRAAKPWLVGLSVGTAGYLLAQLFLGHAAMPFGKVAGWLWCALNALACVYLASLLLVDSNPAHQKDR